MCDRGDIAFNVLVDRCRELQARQGMPLCVQWLDLLPPQLLLQTTKRVLQWTRCIRARIMLSQACLPRTCSI